MVLKIIFWSLAAFGLVVALGLAFVVWLNWWTSCAAASILGAEALPFATAGYFKFEKQLPDLVEELLADQS